MLSVITLTGEIILADIIDADSWRLWPAGDRRLQKDKQVYRDMSEITPEALQQVKRNFEWIADKLDVSKMSPVGAMTDHKHVRE